MRYLTKEWFMLCQTWPMTDPVKQQIDAVVANYRAAEARESLPDGLWEKFCFHDEKVLRVSADSYYTIELGNSRAKRRKIIFCNAVVKQAASPQGAVWLYEELYRHKSGAGYEMHILFQKRFAKEVKMSDLCELKIICSDIRFA